MKPTRRTQINPYLYADIEEALHDIEAVRGPLNPEGNPSLDDIDGVIVERKIVCGYACPECRNQQVIRMRYGASNVWMCGTPDCCCPVSQFRKI